VVIVMSLPPVTPGESTPSAHWIGDSLGLRARLNAEARGKYIASAGY